MDLSFAKPEQIGVGNAYKARPRNEILAPFWASGLCCVGVVVGFDPAEGQTRKEYDIKNVYGVLWLLFG